MARSNLIMVRAGDRSIHPGWLTGASRNWDLWVEYYGDQTGRYQGIGEYYTTQKSTKFCALYETIRRSIDIIRQYEFIMLADDDVEANAATFDGFFNLCRHFGLALSQPSLTADSYFSHAITLNNPNFLLRYTNFVEPMLPCFERSFLERCLDTFQYSGSGWGLDFVWPTLVAAGEKVAIVDAIQVKHTRPVGGPLYKDLAHDPAADMKAVMARYSVKREDSIATGALDKAGRPVPRSELLWQNVLPNIERLASSPAPGLILGHLLPQIGHFYQHPPYAGSYNSAERLDVARALVSLPPGSQPPMALLERYAKLAEHDPEQYPMPEWEVRYANLLKTMVVKRTGNDRVTAYLAALLYDQAHRIGDPPNLTQIVETYRSKALGWFMRRPAVWIRQGEVEAYYAMVERLSREIEALVERNPNDRAAVKLKSQFVLQLYAAPLHATTCDLRTLHERWGRFIRQALENEGVKVDHKFPPLEPGRRIKIGILMASFRYYSELYTTLPYFGYLDRNRFEIELFALDEGDPDCEARCEALLGCKITHLPMEIGNIDELRSRDLDVLLYGSNIISGFSRGSVLGNCRLARTQISTFSSVATTGASTMDYYVTGEFSETGRPQDYYTEKPLLFPGSGFCFDYSLEPSIHETPFTRETFLFPEDAIVFASGANMYKICEPAVRVWARILRATPGSLMVLYPYSPDWNVAYEHERFENMLHEIFESEGVAKHRLRILGALSGKAKIRALLRLIDVYLDGFPYAGANSMVDALLTDTPPVALGGKTMRERMGAALMMEVGLDPLVAGDEATYERIAIRLGSDPTERQYWRERIAAGMAASPRFLDPQAYCAHFSSVLEEIMAPALQEVTHA